ncbi:cytochrome P460 [Hydrogenivirga caldilitoris]|uniref:Cytochrome P460 n=1 Tax=Hydrogenivirga caldilitoris TaxID=246264 RepID=A0A497XPH8_9AQUI|nr:cytochrome P460 family protein [Hydrogenivirga caldilitoris]RLJ70855.1 cytochrome P460 [Hydrogenivirga caldilitoris]
MKRYTILGIAALGALSFLLAGEKTFKVSPEQYRSWNHVKSMVIFDERHPLYNPFSGIHHVYVNDKGLSTIKKTNKRKFPDGTVIAITFYEHKPVDNNTAYVEGAKRIVAFMVKDGRKYKDTDGWGYFAYDGKGASLVKNMAADCHSCHTQVRDKDFVFSVWTE